MRMGMTELIQRIERFFVSRPNTAEEEGSPLCDVSALNYSDKYRELAWRYYERGHYKG